MEFIELITDIQGFIVFDSLIVQSQGEIRNKEGETFQFENKAGFITFKNKLYLDDKEGGYMILDHSFNVIEKGNDKAFFYVSKDVIGVQEVCNEGIITGLSRDGESCFFEELNFNFFGTDNLYAGNKFVFKLNNETISIFDVRTKEFIKIPLNSLQIDNDTQLQIMKFSGVFNMRGIITLNNGELLVLDLEKGEKKNFIENAQMRSGLHQKQIDTPIFVGLNHWTYIEVNVETGDIISKEDLSPLLKNIASIPEESPCWLSINTSIYEDGLMYFCADKNLVGVYDPLSQKIIDYHWFEFKNKATTLKGGESFQIKDKKMYCLDSNNDLHILNL